MYFSLPLSGKTCFQDISNDSMLKYNLQDTQTKFIIQFMLSGRR